MKKSSNNRNSSSKTRFRKGKSGNPRGRPKARRKEEKSAFAILEDSTITTQIDGEEAELTVEELLQEKTYQEAIAGSKRAQRDVLNMIIERERVLAKKRRPKPTSERRVEVGDPQNAVEAMLLLGIAKFAETELPEPDPLPGQLPDPPKRTKLIEFWATQMALKRRGLGQISNSERDLIYCATDGRDELQWPERVLP